MARDHAGSLVRTVLAHPYRSATVLLLLCAAAAVAGFGTGLEGLQALTRYTGRAGFLVFALVFSISPWRRMWPGEMATMALRRRRQLGLSFAYVHTVHLAVLLTYLEATGAERDPGRLAGGIAGYAALFVMTTTSNAASVRKLGRRAWSGLHTVCLYYLWLVFFLAYLPRVMGTLPGSGSGPVEAAAGLALAVAIMILRMTAY